MTNNKPLGEWTLNEVKAECHSRGKRCGDCPFLIDGNSGCRLLYSPERWDLPEPPRFTLDEEAALRVLKAAGHKSIERDYYGNVSLHDNSSIRSYLPNKLFPSIKPGQEVKL